MEFELIKKFFENKCTSEEAQTVIEWLEHSATENDLEQEFKKRWYNIKVKSGDYEDWSEQLEIVREKIAMEELYSSLELEETHKKTRDKSTVSKREILQYSESRTKRHVIPFLITTLIIAIVAIGYFKFPVSTTNEPAITQLIKSTEKGQKLSIHLNDGSKVILNSGSTLYYPSIFGSSDRTVRLEGEAFFEVNKDTLRPFRVVTESVITTALGTSFNVNAFPNEKDIEIALVTGKVSVQKIDGPRGGGVLILDPGEMATVKKLDHSIIKSNFKVNQIIAWKDGIIYFDNASYPDVIRTLENWYGVSFSIEGYPEKEWDFSGKFEQETLENVLDALKYGHDFKYSINRNEVILKF